MECLHGVLMHNDEKTGEDHKAEDQYLRFKSNLETGAEPAGPQDAEVFMHETLMHGGNEQGHHHEENEQTLPEVRTKAGPMDLNDVIHEGMHGKEGIPHKHDWDKNDQAVDAKQGPMDEQQMMHGMLMHGDPNHVHDSEDNDATESAVADAGPAGPPDAENMMHGILMHGDAGKGKHHEHDDEVKIEEIEMVGPNGNMLHGILMHGDASIGHDHSDEDTNAEHDVFSDITRIKDIVLDEDLLKMIDLEKILMKDMEEYADYLLNGEDSLKDGSTTATVSDNILSDIELMKNRYLAKDDNNADDILDDGLTQKNIPFTSKDAESVLQPHVHDDDSEEIEHNLELLGSTEPLNSRHKVKMALENEKK